MVNFDVDTVLKDLEKKSFKGVFHDNQFYSKESEATYMKLEYSPGKLIKRQMSPVLQREYVGEVLLEGGYPVSLEEYLDGKKLKSHDEADIEKMVKNGVIQMLFIEHDPRAWLSAIKEDKIKGSQKDDAISFRMDVRDVVFGSKIEREVTFYYKEKLDKMTIKKRINGKDHETREIEFSY